MDENNVRTFDDMMDYAWIRFINIYDYAYLAGVEPIASNYAAVFHFQGASQEQLFMIALIDPTTPTFSWHKMDWDLASRSLEAKLKIVGVKGSHLYFGGQTNGYYNT